MQKRGPKRPKCLKKLAKQCLSFPLLGVLRRFPHWMGLAQPPFPTCKRVHLDVLLKVHREPCRAAHAQ